MVATKSGKQITAEPTMSGEEANLGLVSLQLNAQERSETWLTDIDDDEVTHMLRLHQVLREEIPEWGRFTNITIGKNASVGEEQVIEAEFAMAGGKKSVAPIGFLKRGECNLIQLDIHFPAGTIFRLVEGQGPVYVLGSHIVSPTPEDDVVESEDIEEEEDDEDEEDHGQVLINDEKHLEHALLEENLSKKRKPDGECENGIDVKKFKTKSIGNSGSEDENGPDDSPAME